MDIYRLEGDVSLAKTKDRILGLMKMRRPDGTLMFEDGLTAEEIAQQLVGIGCNRVPNHKFIQEVKTACDILTTEQNMSRSDREDVKSDTV